MQLVNYFFQEDVKEEDKITYLSETIIPRMIFTNVYTSIKTGDNISYIRLIFIGRFSKKKYVNMMFTFLTHHVNIEEYGNS